MIKIFFRKSNLLMILVFFFSTIFYLWQHYLGVSWDFASYVLNAKYLFDSGNYFEILRPPVVPLLLWFFHLFFGWILAEYIFIIFVSFLFFYSSYKLSKILKFNPLLFYVLSLSFYTLRYGLVNGTELLSIVFLELSLLYLLSNNYFSGFFMGFSALTRYTGLVFFPILFFHKKIKNVLISLFLFGFTFVPWFIYNFYKTGNFFTSIADQYANNILYRSYISQDIVFNHFVQVFGFLFLFCLFGFFIVFFNLILSVRDYRKFNFINYILDNRVQIVMLCLFIYSIFSYASIPIKNQRYLFTLILPIAYFSYVSLHYLFSTFFSNLTNKKFLLNFLILLLFLFNITYAFHIENKYNEVDILKYEKAINKIHELNLTKNSIRSNEWVYLNYLGLDTLPFPMEKEVIGSIKNGEKTVLFRGIADPEYTQDSEFIGSLLKIYESDLFIIIGDININSNSSKYDLTYLESTKIYAEKYLEKNLNINPCFILFQSIQIVEMACNFVNFNNFSLDQNREIS